MVEILLLLLSTMKRKNNFTNTSVSFEDFEQAMMASSSKTSPVDELVRERLALEKDARKKETELKKAYKKSKQKT
jgi:hypothetical protein